MNVFDRSQVLLPELFIAGVGSMNSFSTRIVEAVVEFSLTQFICLCFGTRRL